MLTLLTLNIQVIFVCMLLLWLLSLRLKDVSIIDRFWGLLYVIQVWLIAWQVETWTPRIMLVGALVSLWGVRLSLHLHLRNRGLPEDYRYQQMRLRHGPHKFWWYSFLSVFCIQGVLAVLIGSPFLFIAQASHLAWTAWDFLGGVLFTTGFIFEAVGDHQLKAFKRDPTQRGKLLTTGLWSLTRHPNYFGDALLWWGIGCFALTAPYGYLSLGGPLLMQFLLMKVSGVKLLEKQLEHSKPGYRTYMETTPAFYPDLRKLWKKS
ncbi:MAG: DUF1295 domain-containing protein [Zetaproteobacteria bacterium]|nr:DUF1295 domain-containing protein [Zetaproteobacteria bacterium]